MKYFKKISLPILTLLIGYSCQTTDVHTELESKLDNVRFNSEELRLRINTFALKFSGIVETAADEIISNTDDFSVKQNALLWKLNSIPAMNEAVFIVEPFAAAIDTWAYCLQMVDFFEKGNGMNLFAQSQSIAINTSKILEAEIRKLVYEGLLDIERNFADKYAYPWVKENPIHDLSFTRESTLNMTAKLISDRKRNLATSVGEIETTLHDLSMKLNIYYDQLPKLAAWRLEYLANKAIYSEKINSLENNLGSITRSFERISELAENSQLLLDSSIQSAFRRMDSLREKLYSDIQYERQLVFSELSNERKIILEEINEQRLETIKELKLISQELVGTVSAKANDSIDHFYIRLIQLLLVLFVLSLIFIYIYRRFLLKQ